MGKNNRSNKSQRPNQVVSSRPSRGEEVNGTASPASSGTLVAVAEVLDEPIDREKSKESLMRLLPRRMSKEEASAAGILKEDSPEEEMVKKELLVSKVANIVEHRPAPEEMIKNKGHIINPLGASGLSDSLVQTAIHLEKQLTADKLDRHLHKRPDAVELKQLRVLHDDSISGNLQATQEKLERKMSADAVHRKLASRPSLKELNDKGVVEESGIASKLAGTVKTLERQMVQDQVSHLLESRPPMEDLVIQHICDGPEVSPAIQGPMHVLERKLTADKISRHLRRRPSMDELESLGVLEDYSKKNKEAPQTKVHRLSARARYAIALKATSRLFSDQTINDEEKALLKNLILEDDNRILATIECYELNHDAEELLDTFYRVTQLKTR